MAERVCPVWIGYFLLSPLRKLAQDPYKILMPYVKNGTTVMDTGSAMGYFSLPMADLVGDTGKVYCIDLQQGMIDKLQKRAHKKGLASRIEARKCNADSLLINDLSGKLDFALAFAMVHEVPDPKRLLSEIYASLKPGGKLLIAEPGGHVSVTDFQQTLKLALDCGFQVSERPSIAKSLSVELTK